MARVACEAFELGDLPAGDEQVMVYEVLGGIVPERGIPLQIGAVVSNVESLCNVAHALDGKPVTHRYLTVGCEVRKPMVVRVPVGTRVASECCNLRAGRPLTNIAWWTAWIVDNSDKMIGTTLC